MLIQFKEGNMIKYKLSPGLTLNNLQRFLDDYQSQKLTPHYKSQPEPLQ